MKGTRIRAITVGLDPSVENPLSLTETLENFFVTAEKAYQQAGFPVQTRRLTLTPMQPTDAAACYQIKSTIETLERITEQAGIRWVCLPLRGEKELSPDLIKILTHILYQYPKLFLHFMTAQHGSMSSPFSLSAARVVLAVSRLSNNGFDNFRVGVGANINANTPYFPFSFHEGKRGFSLAVELIEILIERVKELTHTSLHVIRDELIKIISPILEEIDSIGKDIENETGFEYRGQDISIAPFPDEVRSVASLIEGLGPPHCGQSGTLIVTSLLTDVLKTAINRTQIRHAGFNGVMFSVLEDRALAKANNHHHLSIEKLMLYGAVCGCGIDMVPVPGDIFEEDLNSLFLDVASLSTVLKKPLGVRVLPIPMKTMNERTNFNHDFLTNTRIMALDAQRLAVPLSLEAGFNYLRFNEQKEYSV